VLTIVWDVDDVLNDMTGQWRSWCCTCTGLELPPYEALIANPPHETVGMGFDEYLASLDEFRLSEAARLQAPVPEVLAWFEAHGSRYRHVALTATPLVTAPSSADWVIRNFGRWIRTFHFVPSPRSDDGIDEYETKGDVLKRFHADAFLDDLPANLAAARAAGVDTVEFPRPWNDTAGTIADALARLDETLARKEHARG
jgi:hypothetical protein